MKKSNIIPRPLYLEQITPYIDKDLIKVIVGQRRVGKSYILLQIIDHLQKKKIPQKNILSIDKESKKFHDIKNSRDLIQYIDKIFQKVRGKKYIFIDEVQEIVGFEKAVRSYNADPDYDVYITGSNSSILSSDLSTLLSGRFVQFEVFPLNFQEFVTFHKLPNNDDSLLKFFQHGGMPYLIHLGFDEETNREYLKTIYTSILFHDIIRRYDIRNTHLLEKLCEYMAENIGNLFSANKISNYLRTKRIVHASPKVILEYISHITSSFFFHEVKRKDIQGKKIFETHSKYYINDNGIRNAIFGYTRDDIDRIIENIVYMHLKSKGYEVFIGTLGKKEIDFIASKGDQTIYVQACYLLSDKKTQKREFGNLLKIKDNYEKIVISMDPMTFDDYRGMRHLKLLKFLLTY